MSGYSDTPNAGNSTSTARSNRAGRTGLPALGKGRHLLALDFYMPQTFWVSVYSHRKNWGFRVGEKADQSINCYA